MSVLYADDFVDERWSHSGFQILLDQKRAQLFVGAVHIVRTVFTSDPGLSIPVLKRWPLRAANRVLQRFQIVERGKTKPACHSRILFSIPLDQFDCGRGLAP